MRGVYFHNFNFERLFASLAHTQAEVDESLNVMEAATKVVTGRLNAMKVDA
jgi:glutamate-1-semialdehyde aminotransferase